MVDNKKSYVDEDPVVGSYSAGDCADKDVYSNGICGRIAPHGHYREITLGGVIVGK